MSRAYPDDADHAPLLGDPAAARVMMAGDVVSGDLILASFPDRSADYFNDQYEARPQTYDPTCLCGVCCGLIDAPGLQVNPKMLTRLAELEQDLLQRRQRAESEGRLGEIDGINITLTFLRTKQADAARMARRPVDLGLPRPRTP
ncbi:hypothetical protein [Streptomyces sp. NPDC020681]|uniref:hypothetical protein n=1 Tax=Streptomyces sp. NPDC020681 TaxID=3365083 RepID=UPI0037A9E29F